MKRYSLLIAVLCIVAFASACGGPSRGTEVGNPGSSVEEHTYYNTEHDIRIDYPAGWRAEEQGDDEVVFTPTGSTTGTVANVVFSALADAPFDLRTFVETARPDLILDDYDVAGFEAGLISEIYAFGPVNHVREIYLLSATTLVHFVLTFTPADDVIDDFAFAPEDDVDSEGDVPIVTGQAEKGRFMNDADDEDDDPVVTGRADDPQFLKGVGE